MRCFFIHFKAIRIFQSKYISAELNDRTLHAQANTKEGYLVLPNKLNSSQFTIETSLAKAWCYQYTFQVFQLFFYIFIVETFSCDIFHFYFRFIYRTSVDKTFRN